MQAIDVTLALEVICLIAAFAFWQKTQMRLKIAAKAQVLREKARS